MTDRGERKVQHTTGLIGDRRRNPFPSLNDTEYELLMMQIEKAAERGAQKAVAAYMTTCDEHRERIKALEVVVFGSTEHNIVGLDQRVETNSATIGQIRRVTWTAVSALIVGFVGLLIGLVQFAILGR